MSVIMQMKSTKGITTEQCTTKSMKKEIWGILWLADSCIVDGSGQKEKAKENKDTGGKENLKSGDQKMVKVNI